MRGSNRDRQSSLRGTKASLSRLPADGFQQCVKVLELCVLDNDAPLAAAVFNVDLEAENPLEALLDFAYVGIDGGFGLFLWLCVAVGMNQALNVALRLANRKRKVSDSLGCFFDVLGMFQREEGARMAKAELAALDPGLNRGW